MSRQITTLSKWGQLLYRSGLKSEHIRGCNDPKELKKLLQACQNAEQLLSMDDESRKLLEAAVDESASTGDWETFMKLRENISHARLRFASDAVLYEWPALATSVVPMAVTQTDSYVSVHDVPTAQELLDDIKGVRENAGE